MHRSFSQRILLFLSVLFFHPLFAISDRCRDFIERSSEELYARALMQERIGIEKAILQELDRSGYTKSLDDFLGFVERQRFEHALRQNSKVAYDLVIPTFREVQLKMRAYRIENAGVSKVEELLLATAKRQKATARKDLVAMIDARKELSDFVHSRTENFENSTIETLGQLAKDFHLLQKERLAVELSRVSHRYEQYQSVLYGLILPRPDGPLKHSDMDPVSLAYMRENAVELIFHLQESRASEFYHMHGPFDPNAKSPFDLPKKVALDVVRDHLDLEAVPKESKRRAGAEALLSDAEVDWDLAANADESTARGRVARNLRALLGPFENWRMKKWMQENHPALYLEGLHFRLEAEKERTLKLNKRGTRLALKRTAELYAALDEQLKQGDRSGFLGKIGGLLSRSMSNSRVALARKMVSENFRTLADEVTFQDNIPHLDLVVDSRSSLNVKLLKLSELMGAGEDNGKNVYVSFARVREFRDTFFRIRKAIETEIAVREAQKPSAPELSESRKLSPERKAEKTIATELPDVNDKAAESEPLGTTEAATQKRVSNAADEKKVADSDSAEIPRESKKPVSDLLAHTDEIEKVGEMTTRHLSQRQEPINIPTGTLREILEQLKLADQSASVRGFRNLRDLTGNTRVRYWRRRLSQSFALLILLSGGSMAYTYLQFDRSSEEPEEENELPIRVEDPVEEEDPNLPDPRDLENARQAAEEHFHYAQRMLILEMLMAEAS